MSSTKDVRCHTCKHYDFWFGDCFAEDDGIGYPPAHNFRSASGGEEILGNRSGLCDLYEPHSETAIS